MAAFTLAIAAAGLAVASAGAYMQYKGAKTQAQAQTEAIQEQRNVENARQEQMNLDAMRKKREIIRQSLAARAGALATVTAQGAGKNGGSALPGAFGAISGRTNVNELGVNQNQEIGNSIFGFNQNMLGAYQRSAAAGVGIALGAGLSSLGGALMKNNEAIGRLGSSVGSFFSGSGK